MWIKYTFINSVSVSERTISKAYCKLFSDIFLYEKLIWVIFKYLIMNRHRTEITLRAADMNDKSI